MLTDGRIIARAMEQWWADHAGRHDDLQWQAFLADFSSILVCKMAEQSREHENAGRFGMSKAGGCTRAAILKLQNEDSEEKTGSERVTFWHGHMAEVLGIATLRAIGIPVSPVDDHNKQYTVSIDPMMQSAIDGLTAGDTSFAGDTLTRSLVSVKSGGYKMSGKTWKKGEGPSWKRYGFAQYPIDGVRKTTPGYWAQAQAELHGTSYSQTIFVVVAKDIIKAMAGDPYMISNGSMSFYVEIVPYDEAFVTDSLIPTWAEAWQSYEVGETGRALVLSRDGGYVELDPAKGDANKAATGMFDFCSYCDFRDACTSRVLTDRLSASIAQQETAGATA